MQEKGCSIEEARKIRNDGVQADLNIEKVKEVSIHQLDCLITTLNQLGGINDHWKLNESREQLKKMTYKQYQYLNYLRNDKNLIKINSVLETLKVNRK